MKFVCVFFCLVIVGVLGVEVTQPSESKFDDIHLKYTDLRIGMLVMQNYFEEGGKVIDHTLGKLDVLIKQVRNDILNMEKRVCEKCK